MYNVDRILLTHIGLDKYFNLYLRQNDDQNLLSKSIPLSINNLYIISIVCTYIYYIKGSREGVIQNIQRIIDKTKFKCLFVRKQFTCFYVSVNINNRQINGWRDKDRDVL